MNCPQCDNKAATTGGGGLQKAGYLRYYHCDDCDIRFSVVGTVVRILSDDPEASFKNPREALRVLRQAARDDRDWFGEVSDDTRDLARQVLAYLKTHRAIAPRRNGLSFGKRKNAKSIQSAA